MTTELALDKLGQWSVLWRAAFSRQQMIAYAAAIDDTVERHRSGAVASPTFVVVPALEVSREVATQMVPRALLSSGQGVHGEHDLRIHRALAPDQVVELRGRAVAVVQKATGLVLEVHVEVRDAESEALLNEHRVTNFIRGVSGYVSRGTPEGHNGSTPAGPIVSQVDLFIQPDQSLRYADATKDRTPYHVDEAAARAAGFPGIILHGACTMAFASRALIQGVAGDEPERLRRLALRFAAPVLPGQTVTTTVRDAHNGYAFEMRDAGGQVVVTRGWAELEPAHGRPGERP
jgi:acyl dehydratase